MRELIRSVRSILLERGHRFLDEPAPPSSVALRRNGTALVATLSFNGTRHRLVAKQFHPRAFFPSSADLYQAHERLRAGNARLAGSLPRFVGFDLDHGLILMEYIEGRTLQEVLNKGLGFGRKPEAWTESLLQATATMLLELHSQRAATLGIQHPARRNARFQSSFEHALENPVIQRFVPADLHDRQHFYTHLAPDFFERVSDRLLPTDAQPKNVLVRPEGQVCLIDVDYSYANPAQSLAGFLVGLDRMGLRCLRASSHRRIEAWKQCLLAAYFQQAQANVAEDLIFFYPWSLLQLLDQHVQKRPLLRPYLLKYYGGRLHAFLTRLEQTSIAETRQAPEGLFTGTRAGRVAQI